MLIKKDIEKMNDKQSFETVALIKSYDVKPTKNGGKYLDGVAEMKGSVMFKVWEGNDDTFKKMDECEYQGTICHIIGEVNEYQGKKSIIIKKINALEDGAYDEGDFFEDRYDIPAYWEALNALVEKNCSKEAVSIYVGVMEEVSERFRVEFAARGHHDAVRGGLLAHTYKVTNIMSRVIKMYPAILKFVGKDLLLLGCVLHDIGKVLEYTNGAIKSHGLLVSHHTFGVELLSKHKDMIVSLKDEEFYYRLLAIIEQHHGEYEETPRTIESYIIHTVDNLESRFQSMNESLDSDLSTISIDGFKLN